MKNQAIKATMKAQEIRDLFFDTHVEFKAERRTRKKHNDYSTDCRCAFSSFLDYLLRNEEITQKQAYAICL